jgi:hypothetical protein
MEKIIVGLCVLVLAVTSYDGYVEITGEDVLGFSSEEEEEGDIQMSKITTVKVPENKLREVVHYDHTIHFEFKWENTSSGEWNLWMLDVSGQELIKTPGISVKPDGFSEDHSTLYLRRELAAQFTLFADSSDGEAITSDGEYDIQRDEFTDLMKERLIRTDANANISVDQLQSTNIPLSFYGFMRSYYDPHEPEVETLDDSIFGEGQTIELGQTGEFVDETSWNDVTYEWVAERGQVIAGYETVLINVSTDFGDEDFSLPFKEEVWIANEVSEPVKQYIRTNTSWEGEDEAGYFLLENTFTLKEGGFTEGTEPIPWGECSGYHWLTEHPLAVREDWSGNYMPNSGPGIDDSSFYYGSEEVIDYLKTSEPSQGLKEFLSDHPKAIVTNAVYNASKESALATDDPEGKYWWNITFGERRDPDAPGSDWRAKKRYRLLVSHEKRREFVADPLPHNEWVNTTELVEDYGVISGSSPLWPNDISSKTVTMASSEDIFYTDDFVKENFYPYDDIGVDEIDWGDGDATEYSLGASSGQQGFGMDLVETLTGIQTQTWAKYYWSIAKEDLMEGGTMASASLDAETGRLISIMEIEGTALQNAFRFG